MTGTTQTLAQQLEDLSTGMRDFTSAGLQDLEGSEELSLATEFAENLRSHLGDALSGQALEAEALLKLGVRMLTEYTDLAHRVQALQDSLDVEN